MNELDLCRGCDAVLWDLDERSEFVRTITPLWVLMWRPSMLCGDSSGKEPAYNSRDVTACAYRLLLWANKQQPGL